MKNKKATKLARWMLKFCVINFSYGPHIVTFVQKQ